MNNGRRKSSTSTPSPDSTPSPSAKSPVLSDKQMTQIADKVVKKLDESFKKMNMSSVTTKVPSRRMTTTTKNNARVKDASMRSVEICATARITKAENFSGQLYVNTDDHRINKVFKEKSPKLKVKRIQAKGRRIGNLYTSNTLYKLEARLVEKLASLKPLLVEHGYNVKKEVETDLTEMARVREGHDRIAFERLFTYRRKARPDEDKEVVSQSESDGEENSDEFDGSVSSGDASEPEANKK